MVKRFLNTYKFCFKDINKFILLLRKGFYSSEYMDSWGRLDKLLTNKEAFYSSLNMEDITNVEYRKEKRVFNKIV